MDGKRIQTPGVLRATSYRRLTRFFFDESCIGVVRRSPLTRTGIAEDVLDFFGFRKMLGRDELRGRFVRFWRSSSDRLVLFLEAAIISC